MKTADAFDVLVAAHEKALALLSEEVRPYREPTQLAQRATLEAELGRVERAEADLDRCAQTAADPWIPTTAAAEIALILARRGDRAAARFAARADAGPFDDEQDTVMCLAYARLAGAFSLLGDAVRARAPLGRLERLQSRAALDSSDRSVIVEALALAGAVDRGQSLAGDRLVTARDAAPALRVLLDRGDVASAAALAKRVDPDDDGATVLVAAHALRGDADRVLEIAAASNVGSIEIEQALAALVAAHASERAVRWLEARSANDDEAAPMWALMAARIDPVRARTRVAALVSKAAAVRKAAFAKERTLADLAEAARRCELETAPIEKVASGGREKFAAALGGVAGSRASAPDWARRSEDARALGRKLKGELEGQLSLARVLHAGGDTPAARAWIAELQRGVNVKARESEYALAPIAVAFLDCEAPEDALATIPLIAKGERRNFLAEAVARHAAARGLVSAAVPALGHVDPADRGATALRAATDLVRPPARHETWLSPLRVPVS